MQNKEFVLLAARYADEKKAENIKVLDLREFAAVCDFMILATVTSKPHLEAVEDEISTQLKKIGMYKLNRDGGDSLIWRVADYGAFLVHLMTAEAREYYGLDQLFGFGKEIDYKQPKKAAKKTATKKTAKKPAAKKTTAKKSAVKKTAAKKTVKKAAKKTTAKTTKKTTKTTSKKTK